MILTYTIPHIFQDSQSVVCYLLDESAEQGERRHPLDRIPNTTSPYPLCFAWLISGLSNWTGMTICFSHFYDLEHLKNKKVGQNIFVHLFKRYWQCSSWLPYRYLLNLGNDYSIHITMVSTCIRNGNIHFLKRIVLKIIILLHTEWKNVIPISNKSLSECLWLWKQAGWIQITASPSY